MKFLFILIFLTSTLSAHEYLETNTHLDVLQKSSELRSKYGAGNVLIVLDIDNTLLKSVAALGSDQWFEWQSEAIKNSTSEAIFKSFDDLLSAQADYFQLSSMVLTEKSLPQIVSALKSSGHPILLLTSRGPNLRNVTERELQRNGLWFAESSIMQGIPYDFMEAPFKLRVSYMNGIFMTSGHHKGEALSYIIGKSGKSFKGIIFADDHLRHTKRVYETFSVRSDLEIVTMRYSKEDKAVENFKASSKEQYNSQALEIARTTRRAFGL